MSFRRLVTFSCMVLGLVGCGEEASPPASGDTRWVRRFGQDTDIGPVGLAGVSTGGVIVVGQYHGDVSFGGEVLSSPGNNYQAYVARYDDTGAHVYSRAFGDAYADGATDVDALPDGSAFVSGTFLGDIDLDGFSFSSKGLEDAFFAKLDPSGKVVWATSIGGTGQQRGAAIAVMPDGGAVMAVSSNDGLDLGDGAPEQLYTGTLLMRIDAAGDLRWKRFLRTSAFGSARDLVARGEDTVIGGSFRGEFEVGPGEVLVGSRDQEGFVAVYDKDGNHRWSRKVSGEGHANFVSEVDVMEDGGVVVAGQVEGNADLGGGALAEGLPFRRNTYLLELDASGEHRRSILFAGTGNDKTHGIAVVPDGGVVMTGTLFGRMSFGEQLLQGVDGDLYDAFVGKLDAAREPVYAHLWGGRDRQEGKRVAVDGKGGVYVAGSGIGAIDFGLGMTPSTGYYETFLVALEP